MIALQAAFWGAVAGSIILLLDEIYERWRLWRFVHTWRRARYQLKDELSNDDLYQIRPRRRSEPIEGRGQPAVIHRAKPRSRNRRKII